MSYVSAYRGPRGNDVPICEQCQQRHLTHYGTQSCSGHVVYDRETYVPGQDRAKLPEPRPCKQFPSRGLAVCASHGVSKAVKAAGERRAAEDETTRKALAKLGDTGEPVTDPIATLMAVAGRANALMRALGEQVDELAGITDRSQARAEIMVYLRAIEKCAQIVESIIRMGIAERLAKASEEQTAAIVAFIDGVLADLGHNPRDPEVAGVVARRLELVS